MKPKNFYQEKNVPRSVKTQFQERSYRNILALAIATTCNGQRNYLRLEFEYHSLARTKLHVLVDQNGTAIR